MSQTIAEVVREFEADLLASIKAGAGEDKLTTLGFCATKKLKAILQDQTATEGVYAAVIEVALKTNMALEAIRR